jgi:hypothetical protein
LLKDFVKAIKRSVKFWRKVTRFESGAANTVLNIEKKQLELGTAIIRFSVKGRRARFDFESIGVTSTASIDDSIALLGEMSSGCYSRPHFSSFRRYRYGTGLASGQIYVNFFGISRFSLILKVQDPASSWENAGTALDLCRSQDQEQFLYKIINFFSSAYLCFLAEYLERLNAS